MKAQEEREERADRTGGRKIHPVFLIFFPTRKDKKTIKYNNSDNTSISGFFCFESSRIPDGHEIASPWGEKQVFCYVTCFLPPTCLLHWGRIEDGGGENAAAAASQEEEKAYDESGGSVEF